MTENRATAPDSPPAAQRVRFGPSPFVLFAVAIAVVGALPLATSSPYLTWVLLLPLAAGVWVLRARVVLTPAGIEVCNGLRVRRVAWPDVEGFSVPRHGWTTLLHAGRRTPLTAVPRHELPRLVEESRRVGGGTTGRPGPAS